MKTYLVLTVVIGKQSAVGQELHGAELIGVVVVQVPVALSVTVIV